MLILNVMNKNIKKFIERKQTKGFLTGANISVGIDDNFMETVMVAKKNKEDGVPNIAVFKNALDTWETLIESAWKSAEPGIVWLERMNKESNSWYYAELISTNPCGEQPLPAFSVCNLGHFVLPRFFDKVTQDVNWKDLERAIRIAVRLQDNVIDYTDYFLDENRDIQLSERRVGIGTMGLGTLMIHMKLRYGSLEGNAFIDKLYKFIAKHTYDASMDLANEKGSFPQYNYEKFVQSGFMKRMLAEFPELDKKLKKTGIRNVTLLTQAPTGSTATYIDNIPSFRNEFGGTTTGIEPYFNWSYWRAGRLGMNEQTVGLVDDYRKENGLTTEDKLPDYFITAMELSPLEHVQVQGAVQKWVDSSISKTANAPADFTIEQTDELYLEGYKLGLKGITIYRDKSREAQVLSSDKEGAKLESHIEADKLRKMKNSEQMKNTTLINVPKLVLSKEDMEKMVDSLKTMTSDTGIDQYAELARQASIKKVPSRLFGMREKVRYQSGDSMSKAYIHIYTDENGVPVEVWIEPIDIRDKDMADALGRMITQFLRFGGTQSNVEQAIKHLKAGKMMMSLPAIVGRLLSDVYYEKIEMPTFKKEESPKKKFEMAECVVCGAKAYDKVNCICQACGQSKCN